MATKRDEEVNHAFSESESDEEPAQGEDADPACRLSDLCRLCASLAAGRPGTRHVFDQPQLHNIINSCLPIKVSMGDFLPLLVCGPCHAALQTTHSLVTSSLRAHRHLSRWLQQEQDVYHQSDPLASCGGDIDQESSDHISSPQWGSSSTAPSPAATFLEIHLKVEPPDSFAPTTSRNPTRAHARKTKVSPLKSIRITNTKNLCNIKLSPRPTKSKGVKNPPSNVKAEFTCKFCFKCCFSFAGLYKHVCFRHKKHICKNCPEFECQSKDELKAHKITCKPVHTCTICGGTYPSLQNLQWHMNTHSGNKEFVCAVCGKGFCNPKYLINHKKLHEPPKFECKYCLHRFPRNATLRAHIETVHNKQWMYNCVFCNEQFKTEPAVCDHLSISHSECYDVSRSEDFYKKISPFQCAHCGKYFSGRHRIKLHLKQVHGLMLRGRVFPLSQKTSEKRFMCEKCGKSFKIKINLKHHMNVHADIKDYKCMYCEKSFSSKVSLQNHETLHTGEKRYRCQVCNERFRTYQILKMHRMDHDEVKPFSCSYCGKGFKTKYLLDLHERVHTNERPLVCKYCGQGFKQYSDRTRHMRSRHKEEMEYL